MSNNTWNRRVFLKNTALSAGVMAAGGMSPSFAFAEGNKLKRITIDSTSSNFEREPLIRPFGFKGGFMTEIWQTAAWMKSSSGTSKVGLCTQNVLWSDAEVFSKYSESGGNALMYAMTEYALQMLKGYSFENPVDMLDDIWKEVLTYGKKITGKADLRETFALNALVGVDNAAWMLYALENGMQNFDDMIPERWRGAVSHRSKSVASIPLMAYNIPVSEIRQAVEDGYFFMKIKIGQPGTQEEMLEKDKNRLTAIHKAIGHAKTQYTKEGKLPYYLDANGRYQEKETLLKFLDHAKKIGAMEQIAIIEEPFPEHLKIDVSDIPVNLAADESAHTDKDALERIQLGYRSIALKSIAKTLSMTLRIADVAHKHNVPCFCADLTVNPVLVEWNKNVAARLRPFPGIGDLGLLESNGHQNYRNWNNMMGYHPRGDAPWVKVNKGVYDTGEEFYVTGGGIFNPIPHYEAMFARSV